MNTNTLRITVAACCMVGSLQANAVVISAAGVDVASITGSRDTFRVTLGGGTTAGANGSFGGVRREINWDGVAAGFSAPNNLPANFFNSTSPRGVVFSTPGTGFAVSGATTDAGVGQPAAANFGNIDASYTNTFLPFSTQRLFTPVGSNIMDVNFFVAGTGTAATVGGFGAIFSDVDLSNTTSIQYFDAGNTSLGTFFAANLNGSQTFSFWSLRPAPTALLPVVIRTRPILSPALKETPRNEKVCEPLRFAAKNVPREVLPASKY